MNFVKCNEEKSIAFVSLARPEMRNAFNPEMISEIRQTFIDLSHRQDLRAIVFRGEGKAFCAGGDLGWMKDMVNYSTEKIRKMPINSSKCLKRSTIVMCP